MRCSWFEPHLGRYRDKTLRAPHMRRVAEHLESCTLCSALIAEIDVVDALLVTTKTSPLPVDFTSAVMNDVRGAPLHAPRRFTLWPILALYLPLAWIAAMIALRIPTLRGVAEIVAATRAITPASPPLIITVLAILALDAALIIGLVAYHRGKLQRIPARSTSERS